MVYAYVKYTYIYYHGLILYHFELKIWHSFYGKIFVKKVQYIILVYSMVLSSDAALVRITIQENACYQSEILKLLGVKTELGRSVEKRGT